MIKGGRIKVNGIVLFFMGYFGNLNLSVPVLWFHIGRAVCGFSSFWLTFFQGTAGIVVENGDELN